MRIAHAAPRNTAIPTADVRITPTSSEPRTCQVTVSTLGC